MGGENIGEAEGLGCLRPPQALAGDGFHDASPIAAFAPIATFEGVAQRHRGDGAGRVLQGGDHPVDGGGIDEGPGGVMDQHPIGRQLGEAFETEAHRFAPRRATRHRRQQFEPRHRLGVSLLVVLMDHHAHRTDAGVGGERGGGMAQHRRAGERQVLLRHLAGEALAASGGNDQGGAKGHRFSIAGTPPDTLIVPFMLAKGALLYLPRARCLTMEVKARQTGGRGCWSRSRSPCAGPIRRLQAQPIGVIVPGHGQ